MKIYLIFIVLQVTTNFGAVFAETIETEPLIVNGTNANIRNFPHQVSLRKNKYHICGGSLIKWDVVVSAAHCMNFCKKSDIKMYSVMAGSTLISGTYVIKVAKYICHEKYSSQTFDYDVALIKLARKFKPSQNIKTIPMARANEMLQVGKYGTVTGWGTLTDGGQTLPNTLQQTTVKIISNKECNKHYGNGAITPRMFCAGLNAQTDSCQGDSGGPFILKSSNRLIGIVSWGNGCARPGYPGVYSCVSKLRSWIDHNLMKL